jgi:hypothetical protein
LQAAEVNQAFGTAYAQGSAHETVTESFAECRYEGSELEVRVQLLCAAHDLTPSGRATMKQVFLGSGHTCSPVAGVGDEAVWCTPTPGGGKEVFGDLLVFFVGPIQATLELQSKGTPSHHGRAPGPDRRAGAERLARLLAPRL